MGLKQLILLVVLAATPAAAQPFAYVASDAATALYVIDTVTSQRVATVSLPGGTQTSALVVSNDGSRVYAASSETASVVAVNAQTNTVIGSISVGRNPSALALTTDGSALYVANSSDATVLGGDPSGSTLGRGTQVNATPTGLALNPAGSTLYVVYNGSTTVSVVSTASFIVSTTFQLPAAPAVIAINPAGSKLYSVDSSGILTVTDLTSNSTFSRRAIGVAQPTSVAVSPDGAKVLITDGTAHVLYIIDAVTGLTLATVPTVGTPRSVAVNPTGTLAYVVGRGDAVATVVDLAAGAVSTSIALPAKGERVAFARTTPTAATPSTGWWWNPSESGRGFSLETNGTSLFFADYMYASAGTPTWYLTTAAINGGYVGSLDQYSGGQTLSGAYKAPAYRGSAGQQRAVFFGPSNGALVWPGGTTPIQRYDIVSGGVSAGAVSGMPQTGWWWNPSESGRGFFIEVQQTSSTAATMFLAMFLYDDRGEPVWYTSQNTMTSSTVYSGTLTEFANGQTLTGSYSAPTSSSSKGTINITFSSTTTGRMILPSGSTISIQRYTF